MHWLYISACRSDAAELNACSPIQFCAGDRSVSAATAQGLLKATHTTPFTCMCDFEMPGMSPSMLAVLVGFVAVVVSDVELVVLLLVVFSPLELLLLPLSLDVSELDEKPDSLEVVVSLSPPPPPPPVLSLKTSRPMMTSDMTMRSPIPPRM